MAYNKRGLKMTLDTSIGEKYIDDICEECKIKLTAEMQKMNKLALLNPMKIQKKLIALLCPECLDRLGKKIRKQGRI